MAVAYLPLMPHYHIYLRSTLDPLRPLSAPIATIEANDSQEALQVACALCQTVAHEIKVLLSPPLELFDPASVTVTKTYPDES